MPEQPDEDLPEWAVADSGELPEPADAGSGEWPEPAELPEPAGSAAAEPDWKRRQRLAAVFGDAMPDTTSDERDPGQGSDPAGETAGDRWLRSQVPPHHG